MKRGPSVMCRIQRLTEQQVKCAIAESHCWTHVAKTLGFERNSGSQIKQLLASIRDRYPDLDTTHFSRLKHPLYPWIIKCCPVCNKRFSTRRGHRDEKTTCSIACSNTHFRTGNNNGTRAKKQGRVVKGKARKGYEYQTICWSHHPKRCCVCSEERIVDAHHYNGNHGDNRPENFAPLCPTHHQYWHSRHRPLIQDVVDAYVQTFIVQYKAT